MDVTSLETALRRYGFDDEDPLLVWLNAAMHEIESRADWVFKQRTNIVNMGSGTNSIALPADFGRPITVADITDESAAGGTRVPLEYWDPRKWDREIDNEQTSGKPSIYTRVNDQLLVWAVPDADRVISLFYERSLEDLANPTDEPDFPDAFHYTIVRGAAMLALQAESEEDRATVAQNEFEGMLGKLVETWSSAQIGETQTVQDVIHYGDN